MSFRKVYEFTGYWGNQHCINYTATFCGPNFVLWRNGPGQQSEQFLLNAKRAQVNKSKAEEYMLDINRL